MPGTPFTPVDFQLVLLRRMADFHPELVDDARHRLGVSLAGMREANRRWQAMVRSPRARGAATRYRSVLGAPESRRPRRIGDLECEALLWPVPLWPTLRFEVLLAPNGAVWNEWLVRAPGAHGPRLRTVDDLRPWSCTVDEVARAFAPVRPREGTAPTRWRLEFTAEAPDGSAPDAGGTGSGDTGFGGTGSGDTGFGGTGSGDTGFGGTGSGDTGFGGTGSGDTAFGGTGSGDTGSSGAGPVGARGPGGQLGPGPLRRWVADFTWGLLQQVTVGA